MLLSFIRHKRKGIIWTILGLLYLTLAVVTRLVYDSTTGVGSIDAIQVVLWNYGGTAIVMVVIWYSTRWAQARTEVHLPKTRRALITMLGVLLVVALILNGLLLFSPSLTNNTTIRQDLIHIQEIITAALPFFGPAAIDKIMTVFFGGSAVLTVIVSSLVLVVMRGHIKQVLRFSWKDVLTAILVIGASSVLSVATKHKFTNTDYLQILPSLSLNAIVFFVCQLFVNGIMEEILFRGYVFSQLRAFLKSPIVSGALMVAIFDAFHIPNGIMGLGIHLLWWQWILWCIFPAQPTGWLFGYLFYRTRSVTPGILFHTYVTLWGFFMFLG